MLASMFTGAGHALSANTAALAQLTPLFITAMIIAVLCTVLPAEAGFLLLRRSERNDRKDPNWLLVAGLVLWLTGIVLCIQMLVAGKIDFTRIYLCLAICTVGGSLSLTGLGRIEELMPEAVSASGTEVPEGYWKLRVTNWNLARLLGDVLALIALGIFCRRKGQRILLCRNRLPAWSANRTGSLIFPDS